MNRSASPRKRGGLLVSLSRVIARIAGRIRPPTAGAPYRPEKHYMRGTGPKSKRIEALGDDRTPKAT
jgi:hypothetical protein